MFSRFETLPVRTMTAKGCCVRGCRRAPSKDKPHCSAHLGRLRHVKVLNAETAPKAIGTPPIDGYLRLLERVGLVKIVNRGAQRVVLWQSSGERLLRSAS